MATYFWVGGAGTWDSATTTNWSLTSGGAGGASVPTSSDDVTFDSASHNDNYTVTITATANCANLTLNKPTGVSKKQKILRAIQVFLYKFKKAMTTQFQFFNSFIPIIKSNNLIFVFYRFNQKGNFNGS